MRHQQDVPAGVLGLQLGEEPAESLRDVDDGLALLLFLVARRRPPGHIARVLDPHRLVVVVALELEPAEMALPEGLVGDEARFFSGRVFLGSVSDVLEALDADGRGSERGRLQRPRKGRCDDEERGRVDSGAQLLLPAQAALFLFLERAKERKVDRERW